MNKKKSECYATSDALHVIRSFISYLKDHFYEKARKDEKIDGIILIILNVSV